MATVSDPDGDPPDGVEFVHEDDGESIDDPEAYLAEQGIDVEIPLAMLYEGLNVALQSHQKLYRLGQMISSSYWVSNS
jgi:O-methyltransferase involved in polyketide biosynthesis